MMATHTPWPGSWCPLILLISTGRFESLLEIHWAPVHCLCLSFRSVPVIVWEATVHWKDSLISLQIHWYSTVNATKVSNVLFRGKFEGVHEHAWKVILCCTIFYMRSICTALFSICWKILRWRFRWVYRADVFCWSRVYGRPSSWSQGHVWTMPSWIYRTWTELYRYVYNNVHVCMYVCMFKTTLNFVYKYMLYTLYTLLSKIHQSNDLHA